MLSKSTPANTNSSSDGCPQRDPPGGLMHTPFVPHDYLSWAGIQSTYVRICNWVPFTHGVDSPHQTHDHGTSEDYSPVSHCMIPGFASGVAAIQ